MTSDAQTQADRLAALEDLVDRAADSTALLALVSQIDALGVELATRLRAAPDAQLQRVLAAVPGVQVRAMLRAAEKLDDAGSPRRAAFVLLEALRIAFDPDALTTISTALAFILDAHGQPGPSARIRELGAPGPGRELRARFLAQVDELRAVIDWPALDDELGLD